MMENKQYKDFQKFALSRGIGSNLLDEYNKYNIKDYIILQSIMSSINY